VSSTPGTLCQDLSWLLSRAGHVLNTEMAAALEQVGISPRARCILTTAREGDMTQIEIARAVGLDKTTMVVTLDEMEEQGLVERRPSPHDRRARVIVVTKAGEKLLRKAEVIASHVQDDVLSTLPEREREVLVAALSELARGRLSEPKQCASPPRRRAA
jgi:DNA-binding MarR family transcriptional regulator